jgi:hypothetical protein
MRTAIVLALGGTLTLTLSAGVCAEMHAYPDKGQSAKQQPREKRECQEWATQQTGVDPSKSAHAVSQPRRRGRGSCGGRCAWGRGRRGERGRGVPSGAGC